jgi:1-acyl-sn-glycerol-3-phosphate acyltransferase
MVRNTALTLAIEQSSAEIVEKHPLQFKGNSLARWVLSIFGWKILFDGLPGPHGVIAVYPHTTNWDFPLGLLAKWAMGIPARYWGKHSLFKIPFLGRFMHWTGGIPVNRTSKKGMVTDTVKAMQAADFFWLGLAPEGTRRRIAGWRSGFYRVACAASVPICVTYFDYPSKTIDVTHFFIPTGDEAADFAFMANVLQGKLGLKPHNMSPIVLLDDKVVRDKNLTST